jgi:hypothetical protein
MIPIGLILLSAQSIFICIGSFVADFNETHVFNPTWPGHARFHNGQTMSMSIILGLSTLYYTWRVPYLSSLKSKKESLIVAALFGSIYTTSGIMAQFYPGALCVDKMFWKNQWSNPGCPQNFVFGGFLALNWIGYVVSMWQIAAWESTQDKKKT